MGETLKAEGVGIFVELTSTTKAQSLIDKICEHVNAVRFSDPITGQLTFRLIRMTRSCCLPAAYGVELQLSKIHTSGLVADGIQGIGILYGCR